MSKITVSITSKQQRTLQCKIRLVGKGSITLGLLSVLSLPLSWSFALTVDEITKGSKCAQVSPQQRLELVGLRVNPIPITMSITYKSGEQKKVGAFEVSSVRPGSPAAAGGFEQGDRIFGIWLKLNTDDPDTKRFAVTFQPETVYDYFIFHLGARGTETTFQILRAPEYQTQRLTILMPATACEQEIDREREGARIKVEAEQQQRDQERQNRLTEISAARQERETQARESRAREHELLSALLHKHNAQDFSSLSDALRLYQNPLAYQGKLLYLQGAYHRNIGRTEAIVAILPDRDPSTYVVQWDTIRNLAGEPTPTVRCVVRVLGTTVIHQGLIKREIPSVKEIECLK